MVTAAHSPSPLAKMSPCNVALLLCLLLLLPSASGRPLHEVNRRSNYIGLKTLCLGHPRNCLLTPFGEYFERERRPYFDGRTNREEPRDSRNDVEEETLILALASPDSRDNLARFGLPQRQ